MTKCASSVGWAASNRVSTLMPAKNVSNFEQGVTQWMSPGNSGRGTACAWPHVQVVGLATLPSTVILPVSGAIRGVGSAVSTGQSLPTSYCPGGRRGSRSRRRPKKPRVGVVISEGPPPGRAARPGETLSAEVPVRLPLRAVDHLVLTWPQPGRRLSVRPRGDGDFLGPTTDPEGGEDQLGREESDHGRQRHPPGAVPDRAHDRQPARLPGSRGVQRLLALAADLR